jgi:dynein heavy chain, axonemal
LNADTITDEQLKALEPITKDPSFNPTEMKSASVAAANLCEWVVNILQCNKVFRDVAPKEAKMKAALDDLQAAEARHKAIEEKVNAMEAKLNAVTGNLTAADREKKLVMDEAAMCERRLELARRFLDSLKSENGRWGADIKRFEERGRTLTGDALLAAAFVSYIGAFDQKFRVGLWRDRWVPDLINRKIPLTDKVDPLYILSNTSDWAKWKNEGLAADRMSLENGAILTQCTRWPLMVDPQQQGIKWIRNRVKDLKVVQFSTKNWLQTIAQAVQSGQSVLIEGVGEELDATLDPVLSRYLLDS